MASVSEDHADLSGIHSFSHKYISHVNGPHDAASRKIGHIALLTKYNYQTTSVDQLQIATQTEKCQLLSHI